MRWFRQVLLYSVMAIFVTACGGEGTDTTITTQNYILGGTVSGLDGTIVLQNNDGDDLSVSSNGSFSFSTSLADGSSYTVTVSTQPDGQTCTVTNETGQLDGANVTNVIVSCVTNTYTVGGSLSNLSGTGLQLTETISGQVINPVSGDLGFTYPVADDGSSYNVTVTGQPTNLSQTCSVTNGAGTIADTNVTNITVNCITNTYTVGGTLSNLLGTGLQLTETINSQIINPGSGDAGFTFSSINDGSSYNVIITGQPSNLSQTCSVSNESGAVVVANITNVAVSCVTTTFIVGGSISNLSGAGLQLTETISGQILNPTSGDVGFTFPAADDGSSYNVIVTGQPSSLNQTCSVTNGAGTISDTNVTTITINCITNTYTVGGSLSNLSGTGLQLTETISGQILNPVSGDTGFTFPAVDDGSSYNVTVTAEPNGPSQKCSLTNVSGTVTGANLNTVTVGCVNIAEAPIVSGVTLTNDNTPTWSWTSGSGGNGTYRYKLDDPDFTVDVIVTTLTSYTPSVALSDGDHIFYVQEQNAAGNWSNSGTLTTTVDTIPPTVLFLNPANGSADIALDTNISATFSEQIDIMTITTTSFYLQDPSGNPVSGSIVFSGGDTISTFTPSNNLGTVPTYTAIITTTVTDLAGNPLAADETWSFDTISGAVSCTTIISGGLVAGQTWTAASSPYCVTGDIQVSLLTLEPGVEVRVDGGYKVEVLSTITSVGTQVSPILLSAKEPDEPINQRWKGLKFQNAPSGSELTYTIIEYSNDSGVTITNSTPIINYSTIRNNTSSEHGGGVYAVLNSGQTLDIRNTIFENNTANPSFVVTPSGASVGGALYFGEGDAIIKNNKFFGNRTNARCYGYFYCNAYGRGGAIFTGGTGSVAIENNEIYENYAYASAKCYFSSGVSRSYGGGVYVKSGTVSLKNNIISGNTASLYGCWPGRAGSGLYVAGGSVTVENSTIARNSGTTGLHFAGGTLDILNSIIYFNNGDGVQIGGTPVITYSDIQGGFAGTGNIDFNPVFTGTGTLPADLSIVVGSPAIDTGNPDVAYDDLCLPPSLGTIKNDMGSNGGPLACNW